MLSKVGNKAIAFINHKFMHPGNLQNIEKVWAAEEKEKQRKKTERELLEQRNHENQIEELRKALREKERQQTSSALRTETGSVELEGVGGLQRSRKRQKKTGDAASCVKRQRRDGNEGFKVQSCYREDVFKDGHQTVWGSYYDKDRAKWGYACCKQLVKSATCQRHVPVQF